MRLLCVVCVRARRRRIDARARHVSTPACQHVRAYATHLYRTHGRAVAHRRALSSAASFCLSVLLFLSVFLVLVLVLGASLSLSLVFSHKKNATANKCVVSAMARDHRVTAAYVILRSPPRCGARACLRAARGEGGAAVGACRLRGRRSAADRALSLPPLGRCCCAHCAACTVRDPRRFTPPGAVPPTTQRWSGLRLSEGLPAAAPDRKCCGWSACSAWPMTSCHCCRRWTWTRPRMPPTARRPPPQRARSRYGMTTPRAEPAPAAPAN